MEANKNDNKTKVDVGIRQKPQLIIPEDTLIKVKSNFYGKLYYKNLVTQERIIWENQGEIQTMTLRELRAMRTQQAGFFRNQWLIIVGVADGEDCKATPYDICKSLTITDFYKNFIDPSEYESICEWNESEINERVSLLSPASKENLIVALNQYISDGRLDSIRRIKAFEKALDCELKWFD